MKGIIFNLLEDVVTAQLSGSAWDDLLQSAGAEGAYTSLGTYPDAEFDALIEALCIHVSRPTRDVLRWFGRHGIFFLARRYPEFFAGHSHLRPFLLTLNDVIHSEARKLYRDIPTAEFEFETSSNAGAADPLVVRYRSRRRLCHLAEGFICGGADYFCEIVRVRHLQCALEGAESCVLLCAFPNGS